MKRHPGPLPDRSGEGEFFCALCALRGQRICVHLCESVVKKMSDVFTKAKRETKAKF